MPRRRCVFLPLGILALAMGGCWPALAHEAITTGLSWTRNVSRIFYHRCGGCHREGGVAPMPLTTYAEVRPWAAAIKHEVLRRSMPPWGAVKGFGMFRNDRSLSLPEIAIISSWVEGGAPEGEAMYHEPFHFHPAPEQDAGRAAGRLEIRGTVRLDRAVVAVGATAPGARQAPWLELTAHRPDGGVEHLLWLRGERAPTQTDYWFLRSVTLPAGTRLLCRPESASVELRIDRDTEKGP